MSPVPPTDVETAPPVEGKDVAGAEVPATTQSNDAVPTTPAPTKVDAYKPRGIRSKHGPLDLAPVLLRIITAVFTLIAFAVIASDNATLVAFSSIPGFTTTITDNIHFSFFFFFSYLLTVNVITFLYAVVTSCLSVFLLTKTSISGTVNIVIFALDQIMSYLLISASTSAATGIRIYKNTLKDENVSNSFLSKSYASIAFSFLAFFVLAAAALISGLRAARRQ